MSEADIKHKLPLIGKDALLPFVPHRGKMLLLDGILALGEIGLTARATLDAASPFFCKSENATQGYVCFELIAQAISAFSHVRGYAGNGGHPSVGFILKVTDFEIHEAMLKENEIVSIEVEQLEELFGGLFSFAGKVSLGDRTIAEGKLLVMHVENANQILNGDA